MRLVGQEWAPAKILSEQSATDMSGTIRTILRDFHQSFGGAGPTAAHLLLSRFVPMASLVSLGGQNVALLQLLDQLFESNIGVQRIEVRIGFQVTIVHEALNHKIVEQR